MFLPDSNEIKWGSNEEKEPVISDVFSQNVQPKVRDCKENTNVFLREQMISDIQISFIALYASCILTVVCICVHFYIF